MTCKDYDHQYRLGIRLAATTGALRECTDPKLRAALALQAQEVRREIRETA